MTSVYPQSLLTILLGGAAVSSASVVRVLHTQVAKETEKALQLTGDNGWSLWVPKKALVPHTSSLTGGVYGYSFARWFKIDGYAYRFIEANQNLSTLGVL